MSQSRSSEHAFVTFARPHHIYLNNPCKQIVFSPSNLGFFLALQPISFPSQHSHLSGAIKLTIKWQPAAARTSPTTTPSGAR